MSGEEIVAEWEKAEGEQLRHGHWDTFVRLINAALDRERARTVAAEARAKALEDGLLSIATSDPDAPGVGSWKLYARGLRARAAKLVGLPYDPADLLREGEEK